MALLTHLEMVSDLSALILPIVILDARMVFLELAKVGHIIYVTNTFEIILRVHESPFHRGSGCGDPWSRRPKRNHRYNR